MTLSFSTHFKDGSPNYFVEKILHSFPAPYGNDEPSIYELMHRDGRARAWFNRIRPTSDYNLKWFTYPDLLIPKIHTIRKDEKGRWREGMDINFVLYNRTKKRWEFALGTCMGVQKIRIQKCANNDSKGIFIDGKLLGHDILPIPIEFAHNDGFDTMQQFEEWFAEDFEGVLIHWTAKRY